MGMLERISEMSMSTSMVFIVIVVVGQLAWCLIEVLYLLGLLVINALFALSIDEVSKGWEVCLVAEERRLELLTTRCTCDK